MESDTSRTHNFSEEVTKKVEHKTSSLTVSGWPTDPSQGPFTITVSGSDIKRIGLRRNGLQIAEKTEAPWTISFDLSPLSLGTYPFDAFSEDSSGKQTVSDTVMITVGAPVPGVEPPPSPKMVKHDI